MIRRLRVTERSSVQEHLLRLDSEHRLLRFGSYASRTHIETYCAALDWSRAILIGYVADGAVRGLGELKPVERGWRRAAEVAVSVEGAYQNEGIGTELLRRLVVSARNRSIGVLHMLCLLENAKLVRMARKLGASLSFDQGEVEGRLLLPWPNQLTLFLELLAEAGAALGVPRPAVPAGTGRLAHRRRALKREA